MYPSVKDIFDKRALAIKRTIGLAFEGFSSLVFVQIVNTKDLAAAQLLLIFDYVSDAPFANPELRELFWASNTPDFVESGKGCSECFWSRRSEPLRPLRSSTPKRTLSSLPLAPDLRETTPIRIADDFPIFKPVLDDASSIVDDSLSVATSTEDDFNFEIEVATEEDDLFVTDLAEEASIIDDAMISDRIYKTLMTKNGNIMHVDLSSLFMVANIHDGEALIHGKVDSVSLSHKLNVVRSEAYDNLRKRDGISTNGQAPESQVVFTVRQLPESNILEVQLTVKGFSAELDEEIVSHLSAFSFDPEISDSKVCLVMNLLDSNFVIIDRNRKGPLRIKFKQCVIEQGDDYTKC
ncbi:hypothetical protein KIN20_037949 [Parelaphostrongylus tenuis]|uniref:Uncharacterized protein n=1 Tax=Parelaphostrongylus tenuis TaxID=148309 RepID=A0AAD5RER3_PARTN|nr:hypothetical protein KIN20_037949 [Parelaphostrongylus tenuis]